VRQHSRAQVLQFGFVVPAAQPLGNLAVSLPGSRSRQILKLNFELGEAAGHGVALLDCDRLAATTGRANWHDPKYWHLAKQAVSLAHVSQLTRQVAGVLAAQLGMSRKCVVLDCDNTLWGGVLGEDGIDGIQLGDGAVGEAFASFQDYLAALKGRGVLLAVCSKNDESLVRDVFEHHPRMRLRLADIAILLAGWNDKAEQLRGVAEELGLGLAALVFVDDNPAERELVRQLLPEVDVLQMPIDPSRYVRALAAYPFLETIALSVNLG